MQVFSGPGMPGASREIRGAFSLEPREALGSISSSLPVVPHLRQAAGGHREPLGNGKGSFSFQGVRGGAGWGTGGEGVGQGLGGPRQHLLTPCPTPPPTPQGVLSLSAMGPISVPKATCGFQERASLHWAVSHFFVKTRSPLREDTWEAPGGCSPLSV